MKPAKDFLIHVELHGLFTLYVYRAGSGSSFEFFPYPATEAKFPEYLATRFGHLGEPADCVVDPDTKVYRVSFPGLRFASPEEALNAIVRKA